ncbi:ABC transporter ATP-binding protein [Gammaproteobacteria bacterium]|nr:ABC transporter ATP-binding protein [Gammaproteobacteria bacterium]
METILEIQNLVKHFRTKEKAKVHAVDSVSFSMSKGEVLGLVGESGSGKSTLGKTLLGLLEKTDGIIKYKDQKLPNKYRTRDFQKYSKIFQMIFQDPYSSLNPRMTVAEIIGEGMKLNGGYTKKNIDEEIAKWLALVGLQQNQLSRYPHEFSGGQRQRIGIARALILQPEFLVCDEPISALDVSVQAQIIKLLDSLRKSLDLTILFIAHDLSMVRHISDRMAVMYLGSLVEIGDADEVFFHPKHPYTKLLISSNPEPDPISERKKNRHISIGDIPSPINLPEGCRFASRCPEALDVCHKSRPELLAITERDLKKERLVACHLVTN